MNDEQRQLAANNHNLIYSFLNKFGFDHEEYYDLAAIGLCKAAEKWDSSRGVFSTFAYKVMLNNIRNYNRLENGLKRIPEELIVSYNAERYGEDNDILDFIEAIPSNEDVERDVISRLAIDLYLNKLADLNDRDRLVFWMIIDGYSMREIGEALGCCRQNVMFIKRKIVRRLIGVRTL